MCQGRGRGHCQVGACSLLPLRGGQWVASRQGRVRPLGIGGSISNVRWEAWVWAPTRPLGTCCRGGEGLVGAPLWCTLGVHFPSVDGGVSPFVPHGHTTGVRLLVVAWACGRGRGFQMGLGTGALPVVRRQCLLWRLLRSVGPGRRMGLERLHVGLPRLPVAGQAVGSGEKANGAFMGPGPLPLGVETFRARRGCGRVQAMRQVHRGGPTGQVFHWVGLVRCLGVGLVHRGPRMGCVAVPPVDCLPGTRAAVSALVCPGRPLGLRGRRVGHGRDGARGWRLWERWGGEGRRGMGQHGGCSRQCALGRAPAPAELRLSASKGQATPAFLGNYGASEVLCAFKACESPGGKRGKGQEDLGSEAGAMASMPR